MSRAQNLHTLLLDFLRFGCLTFGGGLSIVAQMQEKYVRQDQVISQEEIIDLTSVARTLPGTMIANVAMLYGYRVAGLAGGFTAVFAMTVPPMFILVFISLFYQSFRDNYWISAAMSGMQAAVPPIILTAAASMAKSSVKFPPCLAVVLVCFLLFLFWEVNAVVLVVIGGLSGLLIGEFYERREAHHGSS